MKKIALALALLLATASCDFLDVVPEGSPTQEDIYKTQAQAEKMLFMIYGKCPDLFHAQAMPDLSGGDDLISSYYGSVRYFSWKSLVYATSQESPTNTYFNMWGTTTGLPTGYYSYNIYEGIRYAYNFLNNIGSVPDITEANLRIWSGEAHFLIAHLHQILLEYYGPIVLAREEIDLNAPASSVNVPRSTYDECVDYIVGELDDIIDNERLPLHFTSQADKDYGRATLAMCMGLKSRVLLLAASPQFNGNPAYANVVNNDGKHLFATERDPEKWKRAADAAKAIIDLNIFDLYKEYHTDGTLDPYMSCRNVFLENWNSEVMMVRIYNNLSSWERSASPRQFSGYESMGATQQLVDAFRMNDGSAITAEQEKGFSTQEYKDAKSGWVFAPAGTRNMFVNREPRFYVNICFNGAYWIGDQKTRIQLYYTGGSGKKGTWDYPRSGYIAIKNVSPSSNPLNNNYIKRPFLMMRYAEMLLNYVEALNEYDPGNPDIEKYLNLIRERGGLGPVQSGLSQELMREQIRLERRIELCFEQLRYFDTRRWLIAEQTDGGPFYGMNVDAGNSFTDEAFYEKTVFETRVFRPEFYLFPIPQSEINRDPQIVQNPGW